MLYCFFPNTFPHLFLTWVIQSLVLVAEVIVGSVASPVTALYGTGTIASSKNLTSTICSCCTHLPLLLYHTHAHTHCMATTQLSQPPSNHRLCFLFPPPCAWPFLVQLPSLFISSIPRSAFKKSIVLVTKQTSEFLKNGSTESDFSFWKDDIDKIAWNFQCKNARSNIKITLLCAQIKSEDNEVNF